MHSEGKKTAGSVDVAPRRLTWTKMTEADKRYGLQNSAISYPPELTYMCYKEFELHNNNSNRGKKTSLPMMSFCYDKKPKGIGNTFEKKNIYGTFSVWPVFVFFFVMSITLSFMTVLRRCSLHLCKQSKGVSARCLKTSESLL